MIRKTFITLFFVCIFSSTYATIINGFVYDKQSLPVSFASVYLNNNPTVGTVTDSEGHFSIEIDNYKSDALVISFIGYETIKYPLANLQGNTNLSFILKEQPILLQETLVSASNPSKKMTKRDKRNILKAVRKRMDVDFPNQPCRYKIVSDYIIYNQDDVVAFEELVGSLVEIPALKRKNGRDSIQLKGDICKRYRNQQMESKFNNVSANILDDKYKQVAGKVDSVVMIHRTMWGSEIQWLFDEFIGNTSKWTFTDKGDYTVLNYIEKRNYFGILIIELNLSYVIDSYSYSVKKLSQDMIVKANIPFGYKLSKEQLAVFNVLNIGENEIEKFRLKTVDTRIKRNIIYKSTDTRVVVSEKNVELKSKISDKNGKGMNIHSTAAIKVLSTETSPRIYTASEMKRPIPIKNMNLSDLK
ncbi:MAG: carboxypeptidase-like regulatory domain-containing protein [Bacteroidia bacterium]|nr:carboxypeptidase-like regulatory domain-containing protein [Bacteroidia bacterium]